VSRAGQPVPAAAGVSAPAAGLAEDGRPAGGAGLLRSGDLVLDESRWTVHRAGRPVDLSPTEFRLLACLMRDQGTVLTRSQLLRSVWGRDYAGQPQVVETYVSYLRRKLGRLGPPLIHTRRGAGYVLHGPGTPAGPAQ
jgi:two-component system OmpR family response regulator